MWMFLDSRPACVSRYLSLYNIDLQAPETKLKNKTTSGYCRRGGRFLSFASAVLLA